MSVVPMQISTVKLGTTTISIYELTPSSEIGEETMCQNTLTTLLSYDFATKNYSYRNNSKFAKALIN